MDVRLPTGQIVTNIPEGTTQEELLARLSQAGHDVSAAYAALPKPQPVAIGQEGFRQSAREAASEAGFKHKFGAGLAETFDRYAYGLKGLFTDLEPEERLRLQQGKVMAQEGGIPSLAGQVAGDLAITAPVMAAGAVAAPVVAGTRAAQAVGRALPQWARSVAANQTARDLAGIGGAVAGGAATGAVSAPENRLEGAAWGAGGNLVGGLPRTIRAIRGRTGAAGAAGGAAADIAQGTGRSAAEVAEQLAGRIEQGAAEAARFNVPVTAAQAARSPELAAKELGVRAALPEEFAHHARQQNEAIYEAMRRATASADTLDDVVKARETLTKPLRDAALEAAKEYQPVIGGMVAKHLDTVRTGGSGASPSVQSVVGIVERELSRPGGTNAARLYELQKWLQNKLTGPHAIGDEVSAAVKGAEREVVGISKAIDAAIEQASGGQWMQYKNAYGGVSRIVDDAVASRDLREAAGAQTRQLVGDVPQQTGRTLARDVARAAEGNFGSRFGAPTARELNDLTEFVRRIEEPMRTLKLAGTGGGGSQTTMQAAQLVANVLGLIPAVGGVAKAPIMAMVGAMRSAEKEQLARLLLNPAAAAEALRRSAAAGAPLSKAEEVFRQIARTAARTEAQTGAGDEMLRRALVGAAGGQ